MDWIYANLKNGRLVDDDGWEINPKWPSFSSADEAEKWLIENDERVSVR